MNNHMMKKLSLPNICPTKIQWTKAIWNGFENHKPKTPKLKIYVYPWCGQPSQVNDFETKDSPENSSKKPLGDGFNPPLQSCIKQNHFEGVSLCIITYGLDKPIVLTPRCLQLKPLEPSPSLFVKVRKVKHMKISLKHGGKRNILLVKTDATSASPKYRVPMDDKNLIKNGLNIKHNGWPGKKRKLHPQTFWKMDTNNDTTWKILRRRRNEYRT